MRDTFKNKKTYNIVLRFQKQPRETHKQISTQINQLRKAIEDYKNSEDYKKRFEPNQKDSEQVDPMENVLHKLNEIDRNVATLYQDSIQNHSSHQRAIRNVVDQPLRIGEALGKLKKRISEEKDHNGLCEIAAEMMHYQSLLSKPLTNNFDLDYLKDDIPCGKSYGKEEQKKKTEFFNMRKLTFEPLKAKLQEDIESEIAKLEPLKLINNELRALDKEMRQKSKKDDRCYDIVAEKIYIELLLSQEPPLNAEQLYSALEKDSINNGVKKIKEQNAFKKFNTMKFEELRSNCYKDNRVMEDFQEKNVSSSQYIQMELDNLGESAQNASGTQLHELAAKIIYFNILFSTEPPLKKSQMIQAIDPLIVNESVRKIKTDYKEAFSKIENLKDKDLRALCQSPQKIANTFFEEATKIQDNNQNTNAKQSSTMFKIKNSNFPESVKLKISTSPKC